MRVKTYEEIKREQAVLKEKKKRAINDILTSATNNPKFVKLLTYSFNSLDKMITPPGSDVRLNAQLIIECGGIEVLRSLADKNSHNPEICKLIADIIFKLTSTYHHVDQELAQKFVANKGHEAVIEMLLSINKGPGSIKLIKCINNLCQVPQLINKLLDAGIAEAVKLVNDLYADDIIVVRLNLDTMKRISNQKNGRDFLIKRGIVPSILTTLKKCCSRADANAVSNGLIVVDNLCRNEEGKKEVKEADAPVILCDVVETFSESAKIINKSAKILTKIMTKSDLEELLKKLKNNSKKLDTDDKQEILEEIRDDSALVSNLMLVDDLCKIVCQPDNFDMLVELFNKLCNIDLSNKKPGYVKDYIQVKKHFMTLFKRAFDHMPECLDQNKEMGQKYKDLIDNIHNCIKKNWEATKSNNEKLKKEGDKDGDLIPIKNAFKGFFTSYSHIIKQHNDAKKEEEKKDPNWLNLLDYIVGDVISQGKEYFGEDEKPNYAASNILKISDEIISDSQPEEIITLPKNVKKCFTYIKGVVGISDNWKTLKNDLEVVHNTNKKEDHESELKKDMIPVITKFMDEKYKFRNPNLINLNILDDYLTPPFVSELLSRKGDIKANPNLGLNYINAINSVMAKPFYTSSTVLKEVDGDDEEKVEDEEMKEPKSEEIEKKIISKGSILLKRLIPLEEFLRQLKEFKKNANSFNPETSKVEDTLKLEDNLIYQNCALNVDEFFNAGMDDDFTTLKDLIKKEISFIEGFKRLKTNENNPKYKEICDASNKRLHLLLGTLRKLEDQAIDKFGKTKEDKYKNLLKNIINLNSEVITKSTDSPNLIEHLNQLKNNVGFLRDNESDLSDEKGVIPSELYVNSLMKLLNKSMNDEDLCNAIIKTLIALANKKPGICNTLVKAGCPRLLLQIMEKTLNKQLANDAMELLKMITLSSQENAKVIGNQNILMKLFEIRSKFASSDSITKNADLIANELMKLPGQAKFAETFINDAIKEFHENVQKDFKNEEIKNKILNNEETINSFTSNKESIKPILDKEFIKDLNKAIDLATNDEEVSNTIDKLLQNDAGILKKIKDNLTSKDDERHSDIANDTLKIIEKKSNFAEPLLLSCKNLSDYVKDDTLYNKHLNDKIDENFIDKLFEIQDNYLDNPEITKEINNLLCYLALRNPKLAEAIVKKGGLAKVIEELKSVANLNDENSKMLKLNGLKMLNSLLNNNKNLDEFLNAGGVDLINKIIKNEVDETPMTKSKEDNEKENPSDKYLTSGTICTKTPEQLKEEEKLGINSFANLGINKEEADKKREQILNEMSNENKNRKDSTSSNTTGGEEDEDQSNDSDNYFVQCLKIINKGLDNGKNEFVDDKTVKNLTNLATVNFPDKFIFNEIASILSNENVKLNPDAIEDLKDLMKLGLSNKAQFYPDNNVGQKVKAIEDKIANMLMNDLRYKTGLKNAIKDKGFNNKPLPKKLNADRLSPYSKKREREKEPSKIPGKLQDRHYDWMNQEKESKQGKPIPGKLKNRFRLKPRDKMPDLNKLNNIKKRGKLEGKENPMIKNRKSGKGIELYDKNGNKLAGTYIPSPKEGEKYDLYDKNGNKLDGKFKKIKGNAKIYDKNGNKCDEKDNYTPIIIEAHQQELFDKNGNKLKGNYVKLLTPLHGREAFNKDGEPLDGKYADILSSLPTEEVFDKDGNKLEGIYKKEEDNNDKIDLYDKNGKKLDGTYNKILSNIPHEQLYDKDGNILDGHYKKFLAKNPCITLYNKKAEKLDGKFANILSNIPIEEVFDKSGKKLDGLFKKVDDDETPYVEGYDKSGKKLDGIYRQVDPENKGEELYDKDKNKLDGKYTKVIPDILEGEAFDEKGNKLSGTFKKVDPKALIQGRNLYDKNGKKLDGTYNDLKDQTKGEELYDKNKNKLDGTYKRITGEKPKEDVYDKDGNKLDGTYRKIESDIPLEDIYDKNGNILNDNYANIISSIAPEEVFDKDGNKLEGIFSKNADEPNGIELYNKKGNKMYGLYKKIKDAKGIKGGIEGYDKKGKKLDGKYRKLDDDTLPELPDEDIYDENGNKLEGIYKKYIPILTGDELYDDKGNKLEGNYKKIISNNEPNNEVFDNKGNKLDDSYKKICDIIPNTDVFDKNGDKLEGKYINIKSTYPSTELFDKDKNKIEGIFRKLDNSENPYYEAYDEKGNKIDGVFKKDEDGGEIYDKKGNKLEGTYKKEDPDIEDDIYDKNGNKLNGTYKELDEKSNESGEELYDINGNKLRGKYKKLENEVNPIELYDKDGNKLDGTYKKIVGDIIPDELFDIYGNILDGNYRKLEAEIPGIETFDKDKNKINEKYAKIISSIPPEPIFDKDGNKILDTIYGQSEEKTPVNDAYDKDGNKLDGIYKKNEDETPGIELYDKSGNKLDGAYKKEEFVPQDEICKEGKILDGNYKPIVGEISKDPIYDKDGNKLDDNYRKVLSDTPTEELYDKNGNKLDGEYINVESNLPSQELYDKNGKKVKGIFRKVEDKNPLTEGFDKNGNKLDGVYKKNDPNTPGKELYDKDGNKLDGTYKKLEKEVPNEDIYDKFGKYLSGSYVKVDPKSNLPGIEIFDRNGIIYSGLYRNSALDTPSEELFNKDGKRLDGKYKKVLSEIPNKEIFDKDGNKLDGNYKKIESDIPGIDAYDKDGKKLGNKYANLISSLPGKDISNKKGNKLEGIYRKVDPEKEIKKIPKKLIDFFENYGKEKKEENKIIPRKLKSPFNDNVPKGDISGNKLTPGKIKDRFGIFDKNGKIKNNGASRIMGKPKLFDKSGKKLENNVIKKSPQSPTIELFDKNNKKLEGKYKKILGDKPKEEIFDKDGNKLEGDYKNVLDDIKGEEIYDKDGNKLDDPYIKVISCLPKTIINDKNKNKLNGLYKKEDKEPITDIYDKNGKKLEGKYNKLEPEFPPAEIFNKDGIKPNNVYIKIVKDEPGEEAFDKDGNKLEGNYKEVEPGFIGEKIYDKDGNELGDNFIKFLPSIKGKELYDKNRKKLDGIYAKIPSGVPGEELYDNNKNKLNGMYKKNPEGKKGDILYDKNGNKLDGTYKKLDSKNPGLELYDKASNKLDGLYRKAEIDVPLDNLVDKDGNKLVGKYIKIDTEPEGIDGYDKSGNILDGTYKKEKEPGVEPIVGYNEKGNKLDGMFKECDKDIKEDNEGDIIPIYDKRGNKIYTKCKKIDDKTPIQGVYDKDGNKLDGTFQKSEDTEPEQEFFNKFGNKLNIKYKRVNPDKPSETLYDKDGKKLDGTYKKIIGDKPLDDIYDKLGNKISMPLRKIEDSLKPVELYDKTGNKLDGEYIRPFSSIPSMELFDKNKNKLNGLFRKTGQSIPGAEAYDLNGNKLDGNYKKVKDDDPKGEEIYDEEGNKLDGIYRNIKNDSPGIELYDKNGKKLEGEYKPIIGESPKEDELYNKNGKKLEGKYNKVIDDLPKEEIYDKNGNKLDDDYIDVISSLPQEDLYDQNGYKVSGLYKKDEPECEDDEDLFDENGVKLDGKYKKILQANPSKEEIFDKNGNKLNDNYKKKINDISGIDVFDKDGNKLDGKYVNILSNVPTDEIFDKKGDKLSGVYKKVDSNIPYEELFDKDGNKLDGVFTKSDKGIEGYDKDGKKLDDKYEKIKSDVPDDEPYDEFGNLLDGTYKKNKEGEEGDKIYDKNGNRLDGTYKKLENDSPSIEVFDKNKNKLDGTYTKIIGEEPTDQLYDKNGKKLEGIFNKIESNIPTIEVFDKNGNKLNDKYANILSSLPTKPIFDKNKNKKNAIYRKVEPEIDVEEAYDKLGHKLYGSYKKANNDEPGLNLYDKYGNKLDDTYKKIDSDGPSIELYDKDGNKLDGTYKKIIADVKPKDLYDSDKNKLDDNYKKILDNIKGDDLYDKNGNKLDGKYVNILSDLPTDEIYDKNGKKLLGLYRKVEPNSEKKELFDKDGNKLEGTYNKLEDGLPGIEGYDENGNKLAGKFEPNIDDTPEEELFDKDGNKLDGVYKKIISEEESPKSDIYDKDGNKINGTFQKLNLLSAFPILNPYKKDGKKSDDKYAKIISSLPKNDIFDKNGKKLNGLYTKNDLIPGKLNDDRFQFFPVISKNDIKKIPGKLKNPFDNIKQKQEENKSKFLPGILKLPFDFTKKEETKKNIDNKKDTTNKNLTEKENLDNEEKLENDNLKDNNKLLTYLSLATEPEVFKNIFADAKPEIGAFFNKLNEAYQPIINKILEDREKKINDLEKNNMNTPENQKLLEPFNINSLPEKEKYDEGVVLSLGKLFNYILEQNNKDKKDEQVKPLPGKSKSPFDKEENKDKEEKDKIIPGKLKSPFDNQEKKDIKTNRLIPGKLKQKFGESSPKIPKLRKKGKEKNKILKENSNILKGELDPEDPINNNYLNNLNVLAEPLYTPENYIFVNKFNKEMDKLLDNLGKFEKDSLDKDGEIEPTDNYLAHLNNLYNKAVPFMDDLHKEITESPNGQYPEMKKEKEENLDKILDGAEEYYNTDEDNNIKANNSKNMVNSALNLINDLTKEGIIDKEKEKPDKKEETINKKIGKLWDLMNHAVKDDENNQLLEPNNTHRVRDLIKKLNDAIKDQKLNKPKMRYIPKNLSKKIDNGEDELAKDLLDFTMNDLEKNGKDNEEIKDIDIDTLSTLSKFPGLMKQIMKNANLWQDIKKDYNEPELIHKKRGVLSTLFNNASKNNYNIENMINDDPEGVKNLLKKMIHDPVKSLDDGGEEIAEKEVDTLCNILKDRNNYKSLISKNLITDDDLNKLEDLYKDLDPKLAEALQPILAQLKEADKAKKEREEVLDDEKKIEELEKKVGNCFENHKKALIAYVSNPENEASKGILPGKLKNPFDFITKGSSDINEKTAPGKLKSPFDNQDNNKDLNEHTKNIGNKNENPENLLRKLSLNSTLTLLSPVKANIKSPLSTKENPEISGDLDKILSLLRKNYNDMKTTEDPELNIKRADNVHKCLNLLKKMAFSQDNHKPILENGFMDFMEKLDDDFKLFKEDGEPDTDNKNIGFAVNSKNVLQACSNSDNAIPIISESPVLDSTIEEVTKLYDKPEVIAKNEDVKKLFNYDNLIFSNLCKDKKTFGDIFNKIGLDKLLDIGKKSSNPNLLDAILNMLNNYIKNAEKKEDIPEEILEPTLEIMKKCGTLDQRTAPLMSKVLLLSGKLYNEKLKPKIDSLNLVDGMNKDIEKFEGNHDYLNSCLNNLAKFTKEDASNGQKALNCGLLKKLNDQVSAIINEGPEKYEEKKDSNENDDENGYLKTCHNLAKLYNNLVHNDMDNVDKFNKMGITDNTINMLDHFNEKVEPKTEEEKQKEKERESLEKKEEKDKEENEDLTPEEMIRDIMKNCASTMDQITVPPDSNEFLANKTNFNDTMNKTLENDKNEKEFVVTSLHSLGNHLYSENGKNYTKLDLPRLYKLLKNLQSKYYSDPEVLTNTNYISGALVKNLKDDAKGKEYTKKFYDLIPETTKCQDNNPDLVNLAMKLMHDGLMKKPYLVDEVYEETVPNIMNLLKLYKDNPEIQENGYKILSLFAKKPQHASGMVNNGLLDIIKETIENPLFNDSLKENAKGLKSTLYKMLKSLVTEDDNKPKVSDELMENLIPVIDDKGYNEEGKDVVELLNSLVMNKKSVPPFVQYKGIDSSVKLLSDNDSNIELIPILLSLFKSVANTSDEYKKMMKEKKLPDVINRVIKKVGVYDKKIEFDGRQLIFSINLIKINLEDPNSIGVEDYNIVEPIPSEVRNFLTSGKQVKIINNHGDVKQMQLIFSADLMKISAKKVKSTLPPKQKYIIETHTIKKILKGHGTDAFKKSKGLFRKIPPPEICFSIIGPTTVDGVKALNVQCENEKEVDKWLKYLSVVINHFKKTHTIKGTVIVKK